MCRSGYLQHGDSNINQTLTYYVQPTFHSSKEYCVLSTWTHIEDLITIGALKVQFACLLPVEGSCWITITT